MLQTLRKADEMRQAAWPGGENIGLEFRGLELGGEAGELLNKIKKLVRVRLGIQGQKTEETASQEADLLAAIRDELADVVICADLIGMELDLDLSGHIATKFDKTSHKNGIPVFFGDCLVAIDAIAAERRRQIEKEGWTLGHDDEHDQCELALAGAIYALSGAADSALRDNARQEAIRELWPFQSHSFKPDGGRGDLIKAGALIAAEIERLDRLEKSTT